MSSKFPSNPERHSRGGNLKSLGRLNSTHPTTCSSSSVSLSLSASLRSTKKDFIDPGNRSGVVTECPSFSVGHFYLKVHKIERCFVICLPTKPFWPQVNTAFRHVTTHSDMKRDVLGEKITILLSFKFFRVYSNMQKSPCLFT